MNKKQLKQDLINRISSLEYEIKKMKLKLGCIDNPNSVYTDDFFACRGGKVAEWKKTIGSDIVDVFKIKSIVDLGCSIGSFLVGAKLKGAKVKGYEFAYEAAKNYIDETVKKRIQFGDLSEEILFEQKYECCLSVEVAEHIPEEFEDTFIKNIVTATNNLIILTASPHDGKYHLNCKPKEHWIEKIEKFGFFYRPEITKFCHDRWPTVIKTPGHMTKNLMIFTADKNIYDNLH